MGYGLYPKNWGQITKFIRGRDNNTCQHCGCMDGELRSSKTGKVFKAVMAVAHLDHDKENHDVSMDRLLLLCQICHLKNDRDNNSLLRKKQISRGLSPREKAIQKHHEVENRMFEEKEEVFKSYRGKLGNLSKQVKELLVRNLELEEEINLLKTSKPYNDYSLLITEQDTRETILQQFVDKGIRNKFKHINSLSQIASQLHQDYLKNLKATERLVESRYLNESVYTGKYKLTTL